MEMPELEYLQKYHHIAETMIGFARLYLKEGDQEKAISALDNGANQMDELFERRLKTVRA